MATEPNTSSALVRLDTHPGQPWNHMTPRADALMERWEEERPSAAWPATEEMLDDLQHGVDEQHGGPLEYPVLSWQGVIDKIAREKAAVEPEAEPEPIVESIELIEVVEEPAFVEEEKVEAAARSKTSRRARHRRHR